MTKINNDLVRRPLEGISGPHQSPPSSEQLKSKQIGQAGFSDLLTGRIEKEKAKVSPVSQEPKTSSPELIFSAHAKSRLSSRGIELSAEDIVKMQEAISRAQKKGSKESLVVTDKAAFVVSVKNNTVITAVDRDSLKENVFTNIDSTILI